MPTRWTVLKFGGTSVATAPRWGKIVSQIRRCRAAGERPCVVVSALTTVTNRLAVAVQEAMQGRKPSEPGSAFLQIKGLHRQLVEDLNLLALAQQEGAGGDSTKEAGGAHVERLGLPDFFTRGIDRLNGLFAELEQLLEGVRLTREASDPVASPRLRARVSAFGELLSSQLGMLAVCAAGIPCVRVDARRLLCSTESASQQEDDRFLMGYVEPFENPDLMSDEILRCARDMSRRVDKDNEEEDDDDEEDELMAPWSTAAVITQGFIASTPRGATCLLGRGGSDTSAALMAALLGAYRLEIWTDVHGLFTSDPRHVPGTRLIRNVSYRVAQELASMGAKVLHPRCLVPALWGRIPVEVHNTNDPFGPFSRISESEVDPEGEDEELRSIVHLGKLTPPPSPKKKATGDTASQLIRQTMDKMQLSRGEGAERTSVGESTKPRPVSRVMAVTCRSGQVLLNIKNMNMWGEAGFMSRVFAPFGELDVSVDLVATSQYAVSLTLDHIPGGVRGDVFKRLISRLEMLGAVSTREPCAVVSVVGEHLRHALPELGAALEELRKIRVHLMTQSSEDLNLSFVVDEGDSKGLVKGLHSRLFQDSGGDSDGDNKNSRGGNDGGAVDFSFLGETWEDLKQRMNVRVEPSAGPIPRVPSSFGLETAQDEDEREIDAEKISASEIISGTPWWAEDAARKKLLALVTEDANARSSHYVYDMTTLKLRCAQLSENLIRTKCLSGGILYAMKANPHPKLLEAIVRAGTPGRPFGLECVSIEEVRRAATLFTAFDEEHGVTQQNLHAAHSRIQFTPNFCPVEEYAEAFRLGARVIVDNIEIVRLNPDIFRGQNVGLRVDPNAHSHQSNAKFGHHAHVRTSGGKQKFGMPIAEAPDAVQEAQEELGVKVTGVHVHVGSGVMDPSVWRDTLDKICDLVLENAQDVCETSTELKRRGQFRFLEWIDIGGGLGIGLDLAMLCAALLPVSNALSTRLAGGALSVCMEPGRFIVADAGVLLTRVTQIRRKAGRVFVGVATGMNSLIRPALYSAHHGIVNLTRLESDSNTMLCDVVGPICESADVLGHQRFLPEDTSPGDVLLIEHGGAYGHCMSSRYNLREPAQETILHR